MERPSTIDQAAEAIRDHAAAGQRVRLRGGGTKLGWLSARADPTAVGSPTIDLDTGGLDRIVEHNEGDFTAIVEGGLTLAAAQRAFARHGQMIALDPPLGAGDAATIGGILATNDSGPLRHRYGGARDLVLGATVVLSDGTVARSGGKVIKNVAGYDLAKLFVGSFGTLGLIARVAVRLHPVPASTATAIGQSDDAGRIAAAAARLVRLPLEADCLDVAWSDGVGRVLVRFSGDAAEERARDATSRMIDLEMPTTVRDDVELWAEQRRAQRASIILKVSGRQSDLTTVIRAADAARGTVVSRVALGLSWLGLPLETDVASVRQALHPRACTVLDGAGRDVDRWPAVAPGTLTVMRRIKSRFDPAGAFAPGTFAGGI